jgi:hypothetical protein
MIGSLTVILALAVAMMGGGQVAAKAAPTEEAVVLRVHVLPTPSPIAYPKLYLQLSYPKTVTVVVPTAFAGLVMAYGVSGYVFIVPKGWSGRGSLGEDGSGGATFQAAEGATIPGSFTLYEDGACLGCADIDAEAYFPQYDWFLGPSMGIPAEPVRQGIHEFFEHPWLAYYSAPNTKSGLQVNGIAYEGTTLAYGGASAACQFSNFCRAEVALPAKDHALATAMLNAFLAMYIAGKGPTKQATLPYPTHTYKWQGGIFQVPDGWVGTSGGGAPDSPDSFIVFHNPKDPSETLEFGISTCGTCYTVSPGFTKVTEESLLNAVPQSGLVAEPRSYMVVKNYKGAPFEAWVGFTFHGGQGEVMAELPPGEYGWVLARMPSSGRWARTASWVIGQANWPFI